jgi:transcriptional regulator with XRE-family HTH domain
MDLRISLRDEYARRVSRNRRYSLRAFARSLSVHHATLVRTLSGERGFSRSLLRRLAVLLRLSPGEIAAALASEDARRVLNAASASDFRADCRWIAMKTGIDVDDVNRALHRLIHERRLIMSSTTSWTVFRQ